MDSAESEDNGMSQRVIKTIFGSADPLGAIDYIEFLSDGDVLVRFVDGSKVIMQTQDERGGMDAIWYCDGKELT